MPFIFIYLMRICIFLKANMICQLVQMIFCITISIIQIEMGSQIQKTEKIDLSSIEPPLQEYKLINCGYSFYVWQHVLQNQSLIEFPINIADNLQLRQCLESFFYRHRHHLLVSSLYFKRNQANGKCSVFYERVFTNLGRIKDIPFIDALMFYYVGLKGFQLLYKKFGYFEVEEYMFHITKSNKVKIWPHKDISKIQPTRPIKTTANPESDMVKKIIKIIEENSDHSNNSRFPLASTLYQQASNSFSQAIKKFREICNLQNFIIPEKLTCLDEIIKGQTGQILDEYGDIKSGLIYTDNREEQATIDSHIRDNLLRFIINKNSAKMNETPVVQLAVFQENAAERRVKRNMRQLKKTKGIQIARSLDKTNNQSSLKVYEQSKENSVQFTGNMGPESPIKFLQNSQKNNFPVKIKPDITSHHQTIIYPSSHYQYSGQNFYIPNGRVLVNNNIPHMSHNLASHCLPVVSTSVYPRLQIQSNDQFKRKNSFSYLSHKNSLSPEYRVVVHPINRPGSSIAQTSNNYPNPAQLIKNYRSRPISPCTPNRHFSNIPSIPSSFNQVKQAEKSKIIYNNGTFTQYLAKYVPKQSLLTPPSIKTEISQANNIESQKNVDSISDPKKIKHRETFISNLSEFQKFDQVRPLAENSNLKIRFEEYKKSFNFQKKYSHDNESSTSQLFINGIKSADLGQKQNKNYKPFFGGILTTQTVKSCIGSDTYPQHKINEISLKSSNKINNVSNPGQFPSMTDVSDNIFAFQNKENDKGMRCQSVVISHDLMQSKLKMPTQGKKYEPAIDQQIWADMMKARNKQKLMGIEV